MAITAIFEADFASFNDAVMGAISHLGLLGDTGTLVVREIAQVVDATIQWGSQTQRMSEQMGIAAGDVQRLQYVAGQTGVSMGTLTTATQNVTTAVGTRSEGLVKALKDLGIA